MAVGTFIALPAASKHQVPEKVSSKAKSRKLNELTVSQLPEDAWDGHMHIIDPVRYPLSPHAAYAPAVYSTWDAVVFENSLRIRNVVIVQPSAYGYDNTQVLDALNAIGPKRARAVVAFNPATIADSTLRKWHEQGVRGVRLNLVSVNARPDIDTLRQTVTQYARLLQPLGWMVQIYMSMDRLPGLESTLRDFPGVSFCLDHFAQPTKPRVVNNSASFDPYSIHGFSSLISLMRNGNTWVKFSAPYRVALDYEQLDAMAREILRVRNDRVVFATDWPHTRFEGLDIRPFKERCLEWAREADCVEKVFSTNAKALWGVEIRYNDSYIRI